MIAKEFISAKGFRPYSALFLRHAKTFRDHARIPRTDWGHIARERRTIKMGRRHSAIEGRERLDEIPRTLRHPLPTNAQAKQYSQRSKVSHRTHPPTDTMRCGTHGDSMTADVERHAATQVASEATQHAQDAGRQPRAKRCDTRRTPDASRERSDADNRASEATRRAPALRRGLGGPGRMEHQ
jgi:hypothetical protein